MYVNIDLASNTAELVEPDNLQQFHVVVEGGSAVSGGGVDAALGVLGPDGAAADEPDHLWISIAAVRRWAAGQVDSGWEADFGKMLDYAGSKGWLDDGGNNIQAHIEPEGS